MKYRVELTALAEKDLDRLQRRLRERVVTRILALASVPRPDGRKQLKPGMYRLRVGDYRVVYSVDDDASLVVVSRVLPRKDVYRWLRRIGIL